MKTIWVLVLFLTLISSSINANYNNVNLYSQQNKDTLIVGYNIDAPFTFIENNKLEGLSYHLWLRIIKDEKNTVFQYVQVSLDSLLLGLKNGSIDVAISPLTITSERNKYINFSSPYFITNSSGLVKHSSSFKKVFDITSIIFSYKFFKIIIFLFLLLAFFGFLVWLFERNKNKEEFGGGITGLLHGIWWSAVTMTTVGYGDKTPKTFGGRVISLIWMFSAIILISIVTASITSSLTVKKMEISSEKIISYKNFKIGTVSNSATERWLTDNFYYNVKSYHTFNNLMDGLRIDEIDIAAYDEPLLRYEIKNNETEEFDLLKIKYNHSMYAFGFNKQMDSDKKEFISTKLLEILESSDWKRLLTEFNLHEDN